MKDIKQRQEIFKRIAGYYNELVRKYGHSYKSCDYGNPESQQVKFRVLSEVVPLDHKSVLDVGCGMADFADFLSDRYEGMRYVGMDLSPEMIRMARQTHPNIELRLGNIIFDKVEDFDIVTANGIFYLLGGDAPSLMRQLISKMYGLAREAMAFNSLSSRAPTKEPGEFYADPSDVFDFCLTLTPWVVLRHDYHPRDFTIYMYRKQNA